MLLSTEGDNRTMPDCELDLQFGQAADTHVRVIFHFIVRIEKKKKCTRRWHDPQRNSRQCPEYHIWCISSCILWPSSSIVNYVLPLQSAFVHFGLRKHIKWRTNKLWAGRQRPTVGHCACVCAPDECKMYQKGSLQFSCVQKRLNCSTCMYSTSTSCSVTWHSCRFCWWLWIYAGLTYFIQPPSIKWDAWWIIHHARLFLSLSLSLYFSVVIFRFIVRWFFVSPFCS